MNLDTAREQSLVPWHQEILDLDRVKVFVDRYPVTAGHQLFVPCTDSPNDLLECFQQAYKYGTYMMQIGACDGFNVGINIGKSAGQTVMYPHVHLIPRRTGDTPYPGGGIRGVIPGQGDYRRHHYQNPNDT